jgi:hypothetical protein
MEKIFSGRKTPVAGPSSRKTPDSVESDKVEGAMGGVTRRELDSRGSVQGEERDKDYGTDSEVEELTVEPSEYLKFTKNHPLGQFLLTVVADNMDLHKKLKKRFVKVKKK